MKLLKLFISITCFIITIQSFSQITAHTVKYQAVARDADNNVYPNKDIGVLFKIIDNTNGAEVYEETHSTTTTSLGHFYLELGGGDVVVGDFGSIEWDETNYSLEVSFDLDGGSNYKVIGNSSILAVPIALYARKSDHAAVADSVIHAPTIINSPWIKDEDGGLLYSPDGDFYVYINPEGSIQLGDSLQFAQFNTNGFHNSQNFISEKVSPEDEKNNQMMGQKMTGTGNADITLGQNPNVPESTEIKGESLDLIAREGTFC